MTLDLCLSDPERFDGTEVPIYMEARVIEVDPGCLRVSQPDGPLNLIIPPRFSGLVPPGATMEEIKPGQSLAAVAVFRRPGYLELKRLRVAPLRQVKIIISIFPAVIVLILLIGSIRWEKGRLVMKEVTKVTKVRSD